MAKQAFTVPHRHAIWEAHAYKCFYCRGPLSWDLLEIDHVIPDYLSSKTIERAEALESFGLPPDFDLRGNCNLAPACRVCNGRKRELLANRNQLIILLTQVAAKASLVGALRQKYERQGAADVNRAKLEAAFASGAIDEAYLRKELLSAESAAGGSVALTTKLEFFGGIEFNELSPGEVEPLLDLPIRLRTDLPEGLELTHKTRPPVHVRTCREFRDAIAREYYPQSTIEVTISMFFEQTLGVLEALQACRPAAQSYLRHPRIGLCDVSLLPSSLLPVIGDRGDPGHFLVRNYPTVGALIADDKARIERVSSLELVVVFSYLRIGFREVLRADLDGDGTEDILVTGSAYATGGTFRSGISPFALTMRAGSERLAETKINLSC